MVVQTNRKARPDSGIGCGLPFALLPRCLQMIDELPQPGVCDYQMGIVGPRLDLDTGSEIKIAPDERAVTVSGISEPGATIRVNGTEVEPDRRNNFLAEIPIDTVSSGLIEVSAAARWRAQTVKAIALAPADQALRTPGTRQCPGCWPGHNWSLERWMRQSSFTFSTAHSTALSTYDSAKSPTMI